METNKIIGITLSIVATLLAIIGLTLWVIGFDKKKLDVISVSGAWVLISGFGYLFSYLIYNYEGIISLGGYF